jgi:hypothetical protein
MPNPKQEPKLKHVKIIKKEHNQILQKCKPNKGRDR